MREITYLPPSENIPGNGIEVCTPAVIVGPCIECPHFNLFTLNGGCVRDNRVPSVGECTFLHMSLRPNFHYPELQIDKEGKLFMQDGDGRRYWGNLTDIPTIEDPILDLFKGLIGALVITRRRQLQLG